MTVNLIHTKTYKDDVRTGINGRTCLHVKRIRFPVLDPFLLMSCNHLVCVMNHECLRFQFQYNQEKEIFSLIKGFQKCEIHFIHSNRPLNIHFLTCSLMYLVSCPLITAQLFCLIANRKLRNAWKSMFSHFGHDLLRWLTSTWSFWNMMH